MAKENTKLRLSVFRIKLSIILLLIFVSISHSVWGAPVILTHPRIYITPESLTCMRACQAANCHEWQKLMDVASYGYNENYEPWIIRANALAYLVTENSAYADTAISRLSQYMINFPDLSTRVNYNTGGGIYNNFACTFDWLYNYEGFTPAIKSDVINYVNAVPKNSDGKERCYGPCWNWYPDATYFNGNHKHIWGAPVWGYSTYGDNPNAQVYIDNGIARWDKIKPAFGAGSDYAALWKGGESYDGEDYGSGIILNTLLYLEAVQTATGEDLYSQIPYIKDRLKEMVYELYYTPEWNRRAEFGENSHKQGAYLPKITSGLLILTEKYRDSDGKYGQWLFNNIEGMSLYPAHPQTADAFSNGYIDLIWSDPNIGEQAPSSLPLTYYAPGVGQVFMRSNWTSGAVAPTTYLTYKAGNFIWNTHAQLDNGHFSLYSHGGNLIIDSGKYPGSQRTSLLNYSNRSIAHNVITVKDPQETFQYTICNYDPSENDGGQRIGWRWTLDNAPIDGDTPQSAEYEYAKLIHDSADIKRVEYTTDYSYVNSDLTNSYANSRWENEYDDIKLSNFRPKVSKVTRQLVYLRDYLTNEFVIIFDRVNSIKYEGEDYFKKRWLLHFIGEPLLSEPGTLLNTEVAEHILTYDANLTTVTEGEGKVFIKTLLPENHDIRKVGGSGYECWVNNMNYPAENGHVTDAGVWRIEVRPTIDQENDLFLHVIYPTAATTASMPASIKIDAETNDMVGVHIMDSSTARVVMFSKAGNSVTSVKYSISTDDQTTHLLCDFKPNSTYRIYQNGNKIGEKMVESAGTIYFTSDGGGTFQLTGLTCTPCNGHVILSWTNPTDSNFVGTMIRYRTDGAYPTDPNDGTPIDNGNNGKFPNSPGSNDSFVHTGLQNGVTYYYTSFTYDEVPQYSKNALASVTPVASGLPLDTTNPTITILSPPSETTYSTEADTITLNGSAADNMAVTSVMWTNNRGGDGTVEGTINWTIAGITLHCGEDNIITVTARDAHYNTTSATLIVNTKPCPVSGVEIP